MNQFVENYIEARNTDNNPLNRQLIFSATAKTIATAGTIEDLQALVKYYDNETEEMRHERIAV